MNEKKVDVICQNCIDGKIIPIKIRLTDDDGLRQECIIKSYREVPAFTNGYMMPNEVKISGRCLQKKFECKAVVFNRMHKFNLIFNKTDTTWTLET